MLAIPIGGIVAFVIALKSGLFCAIILMVTIMLGLTFLMVGLILMAHGARSTCGKCHIIGMMIPIDTPEGKRLMEQCQTA